MFKEDRCNLVCSIVLGLRLRSQAGHIAKLRQVGIGTIAEAAFRAHFFKQPAITARTQHRIGKPEIVEIRILARQCAHACNHCRLPGIGHVNHHRAQRHMRASGPGHCIWPRLITGPASEQIIGHIARTIRRNSTAHHDPGIGRMPICLAVDQQIRRRNRCQAAGIRHLPIWRITIKHAFHNHIRNSTGIFHPGKQAIQCTLAFQFQFRIGEVCVLDHIHHDATGLCQIRGWRGQANHRAISTGTDPHAGTQGFESGSNLRCTAAWGALVRHCCSEAGNTRFPGGVCGVTTRKDQADRGDGYIAGLCADQYDAIIQRGFDKRRACHCGCCTRRRRGHAFAFGQHLARFPCGGGHAAKFGHRHRVGIGRWIIFTCRIGDCHLAFGQQPGLRHALHVGSSYRCNGGQSLVSRIGVTA